MKGGGGGNNSESYSLPWYFAANKTAIDCFRKRGRKGFLFTMGDDGIPPFVTKGQIEQVFGDTIETDKLTAKELLNQVSRTYEVFHLILEEGYAYRPELVGQWQGLLGERAILVSDYTKIAEIIVSTLQIMAGEDSDAVIGSWDGSTALAVGKAVSGLTTASGAGGLVRF